MNLILRRLSLFMYVRGDSDGGNIDMNAKTD